MNGSITGTGTMRISSASALQLDKSAVAIKNIIFRIGVNKLLLAAPSSVQAHILDFSTGDTIDLLSKAATSLPCATGALTVLNGTTQVAKLGIKGSYSKANFKLASDGDGGSLISYVASSAATARPIGETVGAITQHLLF